MDEKVNHEPAARCGHTMYSRNLRRVLFSISMYTVPTLPYGKRGHLRTWSDEMSIACASYAKEIFFLD